ncbi:MAG TPA: CHAP domain-containing protein [Anaeromyxobacteraceae bacterium]|nr:CHAP domain-containing protein [Anaeromyxobacteraceae bacterium]
MPRAACVASSVIVLACSTVTPPPVREGPAAPASPAATGAPGPVAQFGDADLPETDAAAPPVARTGAAPGVLDFPERLAERAESLVARRGPFRAAGERFRGDCSGFVQAVYAAEGVRLRVMMERAAPEEPSGVRAAWLAARAHGRTFGAEGSPAPGDLVFWHDTYDRNRNGRADDRFTHVGIVERVQDGTVTFLHRGGRGVARGVMTLGRRHDAGGRDGPRLNSPLRARSHPVKGGGLAGELFAGYGRFEVERVPAALRGPPSPLGLEEAAAAASSVPAPRPAARSSRAAASKGNPTHRASRTPEKKTARKASGGRKVSASKEPSRPAAKATPSGAKDAARARTRAPPP